MDAALGGHQVREDAPNLVRINRREADVLVSAVDVVILAVRDEAVVRLGQVHRREELVVVAPDLFLVFRPPVALRVVVIVLDESTLTVPERDVHRARRRREHPEIAELPCGAPRVGRASEGGLRRHDVVAGRGPRHRAHEHRQPVGRAQRQRHEEPRRRGRIEARRRVELDAEREALREPLNLVPVTILRARHHAHRVEEDVVPAEAVEDVAVLVGRNQKLHLLVRVGPGVEAKHGDVPHVRELVGPEHVRVANAVLRIHGEVRHEVRADGGDRRRELVDRLHVARGDVIEVGAAALLGERVVRRPVPSGPRRARP